MTGSVRVAQVEGSGFMEAIDVQKDGDRVYAVGQGGLLIFDVADSTNPALVYGPWGSDLGKLHRVEPLADGYLATSQRDDGVSIWDVSDAAASEVVGNIVSAGMEGLYYEDGLLFVTVRDEGLRVYDLSDPTAPALVASAAGLTAPWELAATGDGWLYAADNTLGLVPIDIRDPRAPAVGAPVDLDASVLHVSYADDHVYASTGGDGVAIFDVSTRATPSYKSTVSTGGSAVMSSVADGRLWVADHEGIAIFDLSVDPPSPLQREETEQFALAIDAEGDHAYVGDWNLMEIWALGDALAPAIDAPSDKLRISDGNAGATVYNRGGATLNLVGATLADSAAAVEFSADSVAPGGQVQMRLTGLTDDTTLCLATDDPDGPLLSFDVSNSAPPPAGLPAPDFALQGLDSNTYRLSEQLGHPVLLVYFATW